ncbi:L,D-transpeptidase [Alkalicoccobacillus murimartini]|uniref:Lipoprotein-anchoring transpeptidase ErfK/SrfK n=1 Tax=Alkalicoccobacillus murimartini TaxID=171685 RepID=A0ABT9YMZ1_9BACI|nr:L,D-transpeptidase [Alkalicoccobacillus murimartini]MDQ0209213.1 lipoprotein-anchoring transpeptidase ErfK/SrfK [Alkalicoccobacillus murimartini]
MPTRSITVKQSTHQLTLFEDGQVSKTYPVALGKLATTTPYGQFTIVNKQVNPGGPFGAFWMGLSKPHYGIHGTNDPSSIGKSVSHGCIRMYNNDVLELSKLVSIGTPVSIIP